MGRRFWWSLFAVYVVGAVAFMEPRRVEEPPGLIAIPIPTVSVEPQELPEPSAQAQQRLAIAKAASWALEGLIAEPLPQYCLRLVREVVEYALGLPPWTFYELFLVERVEENWTIEPWARDVERSMRSLGFAVHQARAGDLVFNYRLGQPYGHAGVMLTDELVLDTWPNASGPPLRVTRISDWEPTTIIRIPPCLTPHESLC